MVLDQCLLGQWFALLIVFSSFLPLVFLQFVYWWVFVSCWSFLYCLFPDSSPIRSIISPIFQFPLLRNRMYYILCSSTSRTLRIRSPTISIEFHRLETNLGWTRILEKKFRQMHPPHKLAIVNVFDRMRDQALLPSIWLKGIRTILSWKTRLLPARWMSSSNIRMIFVVSRTLISQSSNFSYRILLRLNYLLKILTVYSAFHRLKSIKLSQSAVRELAFFFFLFLLFSLLFVSLFWSLDLYLSCTQALCCFCFFGWFFIDPVFNRLFPPSPPPSSTSSCDDEGTTCNHLSHKSLEIFRCIHLHVVGEELPFVFACTDVQTVYEMLRLRCVHASVELHRTPCR